MTDDGALWKPHVSSFFFIIWVHISSILKAKATTSKEYSKDKKSRETKYIKVPNFVASIAPQATFTKINISSGTTGGCDSCVLSFAAFD